MNVESIIAEIDSQIAKLQQARSIIAGNNDTVVPVKTGAKRGRPKGSKNNVSSASAKTATKSAPAAPAKTKRKLSPEGRKAIADAMKRRWAERKKLAVK